MRRCCEQDYAGRAWIAWHEILWPETAALMGPARGNSEGVIESHEASAHIRSYVRPGVCHSRRRPSARRTGCAKTKCTSSRRPSQGRGHRLSGSGHSDQRVPAQLCRSAEEVRPEAPAAEEPERRDRHPDQAVAGSGRAVRRSGARQPHPHHRRKEEAVGPRYPGRAERLSERHAADDQRCGRRRWAR